MSEDLRIVLTGPAKQAHDQMLLQVRADEKISINSSKLINWIVSDYFSQFFEKRKRKLCQAHFNSRKCLLEASRINDPAEMKRVLHQFSKSMGARAPARKTVKPIVDKFNKNDIQEVK